MVMDRPLIPIIMETVKRIKATTVTAIITGNSSTAVITIVATHSGVDMGIIIRFVFKFFTFLLFEFCSNEIGLL